MQKGLKKKYAKQPPDKKQPPDNMICHPNVKINLGLSVLRKREDGYHDLETAFLPYFGISDTLEIIKGEEWSETSASIFARYSPDCIAQGVSADGRLMITIARAEGVDWDPLKDLCAKAFHMLADEFDLPAVKIFLEKTSPVGAGLGGGSSDCAFTLKMLNEMFNLGLAESSLAERASRLGSDCAFFVYNRPMMGRGRGEILSELSDPVPQNYELQVLAPEGISVSTKEAYGGIIPRDKNGLIDQPALDILLQRPVTEWKDVIVNDFEASVFKAHPEIAAIKQSLYDSGAVYASMSGSGSALFGIYEK